MLEPKMLKMRGRHLKKEMRIISKGTVSKGASSLTVEKRNKGKNGGFGPSGHTTSHIIQWILEGLKL